MSHYPSFEAELGSAVARGRISPRLAHMSVLARYSDIDEAERKAAEMRESADIWRHIRKQLRIRVADVARGLIQSKAPKNIILARAHDVNQTQLLTEQEVNDIVLDELWAFLPRAPRPARHGR